MGEHRGPVGWLERWQQAEPVRLYLWSVATAVLTAALVAGWVTEQLYVALVGVVSAVLIVGGTALARGVAYAPATHERLVEEQARHSYDDGVRYGRSLPGRHRSPETAADTTEIAALGPETAPRDTVAPCGFTDAAGRVCTLVRHPARVGHRLRAPTRQ